MEYQKHKTFKVNFCFPVGNFKAEKQKKKKKQQLDAAIEKIPF